MDVITALRQQRMNPFRWYAVGLCILCGAIDGLDLLLMSYALPHLPAGFATGGQKGLLISVGFVGYGIGAAIVAPLADRIGRRKIVVGALAFCSLVLAATTFVPNVELLMATRLLTGLAVGAMLPLIHVLGDEYASQNRRGIAVGSISLGVPIGSLLGGIASLTVIKSFDGAWQALFWFGAFVGLGLTILVGLSLPESPAYLASRGTQASIARITVTARRMGLTGVDPSATPHHTERTSGSANGEKVGVLSPRFRVRTLLIWGGYTCGIMGYYFINSWTPQLITTSSGSAHTGALVATTISIGAITGGIIFVLLTLRIIPTKLCWIALGVAVVAQVTFALTLSTGGIEYVAAVLLGMTMQAGLSAYMTSATRLYPTVIRARGLGLMGGISRAGSIGAPLLVGVLLTVVTARSMYLASSVIVLIAGAAAFAIWINTKHVFAGGEEEVPVVGDSDAAVPAPFSNSRS